MKIFLIIALVGLLALGGGVAFMLYKSETAKSEALRVENIKTARDGRAEVEKLREELKAEKDKSQAESKKVVEEIALAAKERDEAIAQFDRLKETMAKERQLSDLATDDLVVMRQELLKLRQNNIEDFKDLEELFKKKIQRYETRILSLEAQLDKAKTRLALEAERFHYNLGVMHAQAKEYDAAVAELKTCLTYNPSNADAHFNLGIIFDDYFKDKENARFHYQSFLELRPTSDDAESVREWLEGIGG